MNNLSDERVSLKNYTLPELEKWAESLGERPFRARQIFRHMYMRRVRSWEDCSDIGKAFRTQLEFGTRLNSLRLIDRQESTDGTVKHLHELEDGLRIESVLIPDPPRMTLCISSQVGCAMGCRFCLTGAMGFKRNLTTAEMVDQVCRALDDPATNGRITNIVLMGMGEPLANYDAVLNAIRIFIDPNGLAFSHRRVTLSTAGIVPKLRKLGEESPVSLAVSLHAGDDDLRSRIMPVNRKYPLEQLMDACRAYPLPPRKYITVEYILLDGVNDSTAQARDLVKLLHGIRAKVNLIPFNPHPGSEFKTPREDRVFAFQDILTKALITAPIRKSRGSDIGAACGQLVARSGEAFHAAGDRPGGCSDL